MATLYVTEFSYLDRESGLPGDIAQIALQAPLAEQTVSISGSHAESAAFNKNTSIVRLHTDTVCSVLFGTAPVATTAKMRMAANQTEYFGITPGTTYLVSVIINS